jgi:hypothetical protein
MRRFSVEQSIVLSVIIRFTLRNWGRTVVTRATLTIADDRTLPMPTDRGRVSTVAQPTYH